MNETEQLTSEAVERIETAKSEGRKMLAAAQCDGHRILNFARESAIGTNSELVDFALREAQALNIQGQTAAMIRYFDVMACEYFWATPSNVQFETLIDRLGSKAAAEFSGDPTALEVRKKEWCSRALGRTAMLNAKIDPMQVTFWRDLQIQFRALNWPDLFALPSNGWWSLDGLPGDSVEREELLARVCSLVRRAVCALGFTDPSVAVAVWLDFLRERSPHSLDCCVNNLCAASAECCLELEAGGIKPKASEIQKIETAKLASERAALMLEYKEATGHPSNRRIYESSNAGIHKPEFYKWMSGALPAESATTMNFERFLREKRPPIPRGACE